jgi:hypothetical protein
MEHCRLDKSQAAHQLGQMQRQLYSKRTAERVTNKMNRHAQPANPSGNGFGLYCHTLFGYCTWFISVAGEFRHQVVVTRRKELTQLGPMPGAHSGGMEQHDRRVLARQRSNIFTHDCDLHRWRPEPGCCGCLILSFAKKE